MGKIDKKKVRYIANLARLELTEKEVKTYTKQLADVLNYMSQLEEIDTKKVKPTYQVIDGLTNVFRKDSITSGLNQKKALSQVEITHKGFFMAEHVFGEREAKGKKNKITRKKIDNNNAALTKVSESGSVGHKDLFMTEGVETTAASHVLDGYNAHYSSTVVKELEKKGLKTKYKLNQDAWGHGASGENSDYGPTKNPWNEEYVPGGSSSGSGVMVASGDVELATGTDTGGSIRSPASYCGITSIKPSYGALSRYGVIAFASSLDCPSLMARSVSEVKKYFKMVSGTDKLDSNTKSSIRDKKKVKVKRIGLPKEFFGKNNDPEVQKSVEKAVEELKKAGYKFSQVSLPHSNLGVAVYYIIAPVETSSNLSRYDGVRFGNDRRYFGPEAKRRIMLGTYASSEGYADKYYEKAAKVRTLIIEDFDKAFGKVDAILAPVSPILPFKLGEKTGDPLQMYLADMYLSAISLAGLPALALPCGFSKNNLPIGMQLVGQRFSENELFDVGEIYQNITNWHKERP